MLRRETFQRRVRHYALLEREGAYDEALAAIEALPDPVRRRDARAALDRLRAALTCMDLRGLGWPPQGSRGDSEDVLHADNQRQVSAVLRFDHRECQAQVLKYVLKDRL